ncbi:hypothetical protein GVX82_03430, partial [Patescibacteria group bacterium]|nr:hypothetical protein [Patescibacteria group bacterium]
SAPDREVYINQEWRFSFEYPEGWEPRENTFGNYYSKFNVVLYPEEGKAYGRPVLINVVVPEFAENAYRDLDTNSEQTLFAGIEVTRHTYQHASLDKTSYLIPFGKHTILLATNHHYEDLFAIVLNSFEFIE